MMLAFKSFLLTILLALFSCSHINHEADVVSVGGELSPTAKALQSTRHKLLQNKNALRIVLLKLNLRKTQSQYPRDEAIVIDTGLLDFLGKISTEQDQILIGDKWRPLALARLHGQLVPEFYQVLNLATEKSINLYIKCINRSSCDLIRQNLSKRQLRQVKFIKTTRDLMRVKPLLVIASDGRPFDKLALVNSSWVEWRKKWVHLKKVDHDARVNADDLARVVPTINEF
jgi:hypothetical protein